MDRNVVGIAWTARRLACGAALIALALPVLGAGEGFLKDTPSSRFNDKDMQLFLATFNEALEKGTDGESRKWSNPATGAGGEIKSISAFQRGSAPCKRIEIHNEAKGLTATGRYSFCKQSSGKWAPTSE